MSVVSCRRASFAAHGGRPSSSRYVGQSTTSSRQFSFEGPTVSTNSRSEPDMGSGAFHSSSFKDVASECTTNGGKRQGLDTGAAREVSRSRRNLASASGRRSTISITNTFTTRVEEGALSRSEPGKLGGKFHSNDTFDEDLGTDDSNSQTRRKSMPWLSLAGVNYGAAGVRREFNQESDSVGVVGEMDPLSGDIESRRPIRRRAVEAGEGGWLVKQHTGGRPKKMDNDLYIPVMEKSVETSPAKSRMGDISKTTKTVQFSSVDIRYHPTIPGNNPSTTSGPPLELAWEHDPSATDSNVSIDRYEEVRGGHRRSEWDLVLSKCERESRLLKSGYTRGQIAAVVRETNRIKAQRATTVLNLKMSGIEEFAENMLRKGSKFVGLRKSSCWLYNDWKENKNTYVLSYYATTAENTSIKAGGAAAVAAIPPSFGLPLDGKKGKARVFHVVGEYIRQGDDDAPTPKRTAGPASAPECKENNMPAFGIAHRSLSSRVMLGDGDNNNGVWPFAVIKVVHPGSPAHEAGLRRGDRLIKIGSITALNHNHCKAIPELGRVAAMKELSIPAVVEDKNGSRRAVTIRPHEWDGRGHFGFLFRELDLGHA